MSWSNSIGSRKDVTIVGRFSPNNEFFKPEFILAIVAIVFATIQFIDARIEHRASKRQEQRMRALADSMSTRFIGEFPKNLAEIIDVVRRADATLDIIVDLAAYGHYSRPPLFESYAKAIYERRERGVAVRMVVYSISLYVDLFERQFPRDKFEKEKGSERFKAYFEIYNRGLTKPPTWESFRDIIQREQRRLLEEMIRRGIEIKCVDDEVLMSLWLEDREDAVFSFQNAVEREREVSFRMRDGNLTSSLQKQFELAWKSARQGNSRDMA